MHISDRTTHGAAVILLILAACGKPMDRSGQEDASFVHASMAGASGPTGPDRPLVSDLAVLPVSMLVTFNRLKTPEALQAELNKKPGTFSHLDLDLDSTPDPLTVAARDNKDGPAFEIRARPTTGEFVVATMVFSPEWEFLGYFNGMLDGGISTFARPLPATPSTVPPPPVAAIAPATPAPPPAAAPAPAPAPAGTVQAVPAGSPQTPGVAATP